MSKIYKGNVGIKPVKAKDGTVAIRLKAFADGSFNAENALMILNKALEASKTMKLPLYSWSFYVPSEERVIKQSDAKLVADGKFNAVLQADHFGKPSLRLCLPQANKSYSKAKSYDWIC